MNRKIIAALLGASLLAGGAYAAQQSQPQAPQAPRGPMMHADANNDGIVTREEVLAQVEARFAKQDANKDGQVSADERRAARPHRGRGMNDRRLDATNRFAPILERFDADKDGKLSDAERATARTTLSAEKGTKGNREERRAKMLERFDADKDGKLSDAERNTAREARRGMHGGGHHRFGGGRGHGPRIDTNGDKLISLEESRAAALAMFDRVDANKDGRIDAAEREAARAKMKAMRDQRRAAPPTAPANAPAPSSGN
jgi:Ca2+-binding EF-hand superfamily protein